MNALRYPIKSYPKGDNNADYTLGDYLKPVVIDMGRGANEQNNP